MAVKTLTHKSWTVEIAQLGKAYYWNVLAPDGRFYEGDGPIKTIAECRDDAYTFIGEEIERQKEHPLPNPAEHMYPKGPQQEVSLPRIMDFCKWICVESIRQKRLYHGEIDVTCATEGNVSLVLRYRHSANDPPRKSVMFEVGDIFQVMPKLRDYARRAQLGQIPMQFQEPQPVKPMIEPEPQHVGQMPGAVNFDQVQRKWLEAAERIDAERKLRDLAEQFNGGGNIQFNQVQNAMWVGNNPAAQINFDDELVNEVIAEEDENG